MKRTYACPHCNAVLNPNVKIVLRAGHKKRTGLFLFSPRPGNYDVFIPQGFDLQQGDRVDFACPVCGMNLSSSRGKAWAEIRFFTSSGADGSVVFSKVFGTHATCFITEEQMRWYGEDARECTNFWGAGPDRDH